ncbi:MAG: hypothetical protein HYZ14_00185 [Bacteroidetes bacterium]|nr:hypothetical protein [Bacteroidota bacterium]
MGKRDTVEVLVIILYVTGAVLLMLAAYLIYLKKYRRRGRMEMLNNIEFITSRYDTYHAKTRFLLQLPKPCGVDLNLLDASEKQVRVLLQGNLEAGQHTIVFDPSDFENGTYFLSLKTDSTSVLRKITIDKTAQVQK